MAKSWRIKISRKFDQNILIDNIEGDENMTTKKRNCQFKKIKLKKKFK